VLVDSKVADGTLTKSRLIIPNSRRLKKWIQATFRQGDTSEAPEKGADTTIGTRKFHQAQKRTFSRDPEHLFPRFWYEKLGESIRQSATFMRSSHSTHGFRVACACMTVAIGFYIKSSSHWFSRIRALWALFAIVLTMSPSAGMSLYLFLCRLIGTVLALGASMAIYYMVDKKTAGVLVFVWVSYLVIGYLSKFNSWLLSDGTFCLDNC